MYTNADIFKIETNHIVPTRGKVLISEPFLCDYMFGGLLFYWQTIRKTEPWDL